MEVDLSGEELFDCDTLELDKKITFVLGKNGTGKTTLTNILSKQKDCYDVSVFKGFDNIIDDNKRLNAVVLGEENTVINRQIDDIKEKIEEKNKEKNQILKTLNKPENDSENNYWTRRDDARKDCENVERDIENFCTRAARDVKQKMSITETYNKSHFKSDIPKAKLLSDEEKKQCEEILKSEIKSAPNVIFPKVDLKELLDKTNAILVKKVAEKIILDRIEGDKEKRDFAEKGLQIHKKGDVCAFCGAPISDTVFIELKSYFSADEVVAFQKEIDDMVSDVDANIDGLSECLIDVDSFYPQFQTQVKELKEKADEKVKEYQEFLHKLKEQLSDKKSNLFTESSVIKIDIPSDFVEIKQNYEKVLYENNKDDLALKQEQARDNLKFHYVKEQMDEANYDSMIGQQSAYKQEYDQRKLDYDNEQKKITGDNGIDTEIEAFEKEVIRLQNQTKNEAILADRIKQKLNHMVSFELQPCKDEKSHGIYQVKDIYTGEIRDITKLSTGEKNIIAFLYFIEKLGEVKEEVTNKPRLIVFDDPMNSNDDNMQYLIIEELVKLMKSLGNDDRFVLLTHNKHFYINVTYKCKGKRFHFWKNGPKTKIKEITVEDDIKTSYAALWSELKFIYNNDECLSEMMLNPIRRIIETFVKFNELDRAEFCSKVTGAKKLFDVNSHSIDDLEADLNGKTKDEIKQIFYDCFKENNFETHFLKHWPESDISN